MKYLNLLLQYSHVHNIEIIAEYSHYVRLILILQSARKRDFFLENKD